uniref:Uncharacterized protein n=1 Tax=Sinocyclocheilus grahami TaxID=75366 RepID=A0A672PQR4_SINGR
MNEGLTKLPPMVSDGHWHTVKASLRNNMLGLSLTDPSCLEDMCHMEVQIDRAEPELGSGLSELTVIQNLYIGGRGENETASGLLGCMRDVWLDSRIVVPGLGLRSPAKQLNVKQGCSDWDRCKENPCQNRGRCVKTGWRSFSCECHRPYEGEHCLDGMININGCDMNPCMNGGVCENQDGQYKCHCSQMSYNGHLYGGPYCTVILLGCERHWCQNGATCYPYLDKGRHRYSCICPEGFTGTKCQTSTAFSFEESGFMQKNISIGLSFKTTQTSS